MTDYSQIRSLFLRYMEGNITAEERTQLSEAAETYSIKEWEEILEPLAQTTKLDQNFNIQDWEKEIQHILSQPAVQPTPVIPLYRKKIFKWIAAACIILVMGYGLWVTLGRRSQGTGNKSEVAVHDVPAPKETRAVITLADGSKVYLDSANNGTIAQENNVNVVKNANGEIIYSPDHQITQSPIAYNTLFNPRGSKVISLTLSDGTKVWLNSESSLKYPMAFNGNTREVDITGEAYFEVKHNSKQPFKVHLPNGSVVEDIGTSFNVNAYTDEDNVKTTLIEGSVRISNGSPDHPITKSQILKPGEQAVSTHDSRFTIHDNVDLEEVTAWKNGSFSFNRTNIVSIMKQVERWYDVQVEFKDDVRNNDFTGGIARTENVSEVLKMLEKTGVVHFKIEGKRITVSK